MFDIVVGVSDKLLRTGSFSVLIVHEVRRKCKFTVFNEKSGSEGGEPSDISSCAVWSAGKLGL